MTPIRVLTIRILALGACLITPAAFAQGAPVTPPAANQAKPDRVERHIADMKRRLQITPAEAPQWDAFAAVTRENGRRMTEMYDKHARRPAGQIATDDMHGYAELTRAHAEDMQRLVPAFDSLYAVMPRAQQALADKMFQDFQSRRRP